MKLKQWITRMSKAFYTRLVRHSTFEKYYFKTTGILRTTCIEECKVRNNEVMIGSVKCQECWNCIEHETPNEFTGDVHWIKCRIIDKARGV